MLSYMRYKKKNEFFCTKNNLFLKYSDYLNVDTNSEHKVPLENMEKLELFKSHE